MCVFRLGRKKRNLNPPSDPSDPMDPMDPSDPMDVNYEQNFGFPTMTPLTPRGLLILIRSLFICI